MRILIVEDDPKMAALLRDALEKKAHRIFLATTGREGLEIGRSHEFEAIVLDVMLPEIDGFVVARSLREVGVASPTLMLTRPRRDNRHCPRPGQRGRRLPDQAVCLRGVICPATRAGATPQYHSLDAVSHGRSSA